MFMRICDRDWPEDFPHENGQYMNTCVPCGKTFIGYKRRLVCKVCSESQPHYDTAEESKIAKEDV